MKPVLKVIPFIFAACLLSCNEFQKENQQKHSGVTGVTSPDEIGSGSVALTKKVSDKKVRICHFPTNNKPPHIIEVSENALPAHLAHGDGLAPEAVRKDSDCLIPQPPPAPVSNLATSGQDGIAQFIIPSTNIRGLVKVTNEANEPLSNMTIALFAAGDRFLVVAYEQDDIQTYSPAFHEGSLLDAKPGSALTLSVEIVMQLFQPIGGGIIANGASVVQFISTNFLHDQNACLDEAEFSQLMFQKCTGKKTLLVLTNLATGSPTTVVNIVGLANCAGSALKNAANVFQTLDVPLVRFQTFISPVPPGYPEFPLVVVNRGKCGGACCIHPADSCLDVKDEQQCHTASSGGYKEGIYCSSKPCTRVVDLQIDPIVFPDPVDIGTATNVQFQVTNKGPDQAQGVIATIAFNSDLTLGSAIFNFGSSTSSSCTLHA